MVGEREHLHDREAESGAREDDEQRDEHRAQPETEEREHPDRNRGEQHHREHDDEHPLRSDPAHDARGGLRSERHADRVDAEREAELLSVQPEYVLQQERRRREIGEQRREDHAADDPHPDEDPVVEERRVAGARCAVRAPAARLGRQRLDDEERGDRQHHRSIHGKRDEHPAPVGHPEQLGPDHGREDGGEAADQGEARQHPDQWLTAEQVANRRHGHHAAARCPDPLHDPQDGEHLDVGGHRHADARHDMQSGGQQQRGAPADLVAPRADQQLADRESDRGRGEGQLHSGVARAEVVGDARERRQVEIDRERAEGHQRSEGDDVDEALAARQRVTGMGEGRHSVLVPVLRKRPDAGGWPTLLAGTLRTPRSFRDVQTDLSRATPDRRTGR